jgi:hypothetical protein
MATTTRFIVQNQEFIWWFLAFIVFIYLVRFFVVTTNAILNYRKVFNYKIK